ncbi:MAG: hypothetical protein HFH08_01445 [Bacilli bacterium]|nr:hypothetical protein [Bacilli bacterium]
MLGNIRKTNEIVDAPIFKFIKPGGNDSLSDMSGIDLQDLLYYVENYYLELRNRLGFDDKVTFGLELEFEKAFKKRIEQKLEEYQLDDSWRLRGDGSLCRGAEINSPILTDASDSWCQLKTVCQIVQQHASIDKSSGGHIHIGTQVLGNKTESWKNFIKLWSVYENIIYRFVYGDYLNARSSMLKYARPLAKQFWSDYQEMLECDSLTLRGIVSKISHERYQAVNFNNVSDFDRFQSENTIEFRCPNGTLEPVIWQNNVNLFVHLLQYSKSARYDDDMVQRRRIINKNDYSSLTFYGEIYLQQALELCDMIFTNNFDKVYFLRQYLKSFEIGNKELAKPKLFVKK